jgi:ferredoxin
MNKLENPVIEIDLDNCTLCKACVNDCVAGLFYIESDGLKIVDDFEERCILCGHCVAICPVNVVELKVYENKFTREILKSEEIGDQ